MLTLCGPSGGMWTQVGEMMNDGIMSGKGVIYVSERAGPCSVALIAKIKR